MKIWRLSSNRFIQQGFVGQTVKFQFKFLTNVCCTWPSIYAHRIGYQYCPISFSASLSRKLKNRKSIKTLNLTDLQLKILNRHKKAILSQSDTYNDPTTGFSVFTRIYHLKRGNCCGSACRHKNEKHDLLVLYGSQTGTAEEVAERIAMQSRGSAFKGRSMAVDDYKLEKLVHEKLIIFICATTGQGEPPDNMKKFWRFIMRKNLPSSSLSDVQFAVLGLGDSSYPKYNFIAKKLHKRLLNLGGQAFADLGLADDQHDWGPDAVIDPWTIEMWKNLMDRYPSSMTLSNPLTNTLPPPRVSVTLASETSVQHQFIEREKEELKFDKQHPFQAPIIENIRVTSLDHFQETRLVKFDISLGENELKYLPGDVVMIMPSNLKENVDEFLGIFSYDGDAPLHIDVLSEDDNSFVSTFPKNVTLRYLATKYFDFMSIPRRSFFQTLSHFAADENELDKLKEFGSPEGTEERYSYANRPRRTILEVLQDFHLTSKNITLDRMFDIFPLIRARAFSIASSPTVHKGELHVLVAVVKYKTRLHRPRQGLCSTWLSTLKTGMTAPLWIKKGGIRFPEGRACIMVGPGTGVAPFRSAAHERSMNLSNETAIIFGCRSKEHDFYFEDEWKKLPIALLTAFSRDQDRKVYVQDRIRENGEDLWKLIGEKDACVFVAGNSKNMPDGVKAAFLDIFCNHGDMTSDEAQSFYEEMQRNKCYQQETWS